MTVLPQSPRMTAAWCKYPSSSHAVAAYPTRGEESPCDGRGNLAGTMQPPEAAKDVDEPGTDGSCGTATVTRACPGSV